MANSATDRNVFTSDGGANDAITAGHVILAVARCIAQAGGAYDYHRDARRSRVGRRVAKEDSSRGTNGNRLGRVEVHLRLLKDGCKDERDDPATKAEAEQLNAAIAHSNRRYQGHSRYLGLGHCGHDGGGAVSHNRVFTAPIAKTGLPHGTGYECWSFRAQAFHQASRP